MKHIVPEKNQNRITYIVEWGVQKIALSTVIITAWGGLYKI